MGDADRFDFRFGDDFDDHFSSADTRFDQFALDSFVSCNGVETRMGELEQRNSASRVAGQASAAHDFGPARDTHAGKRFGEIRMGCKSICRRESDYVIGQFAVYRFAYGDIRDRLLDAKDPLLDPADSLDF